MNLIGKTVFVQAISTEFPSDTWAHARVPEGMEWRNVAAQDSQGTQYPTVHHGKDLFIRCPMQANNSSVGEVKELTLVALDAVDSDGARSNSKGGDKRIRIAEWVSDRFEDLVPSFRATYNGMTITAPPVQIKNYEVNAARIRIHFFTKFAETPLLVHGWYDIFDNQEIVEFKVLVTWGAVNDGTNLDYTDDITDVRMSSRENFHVDFAVNKGLTQPTPGVNGWTTSIAKPSQWTGNRWSRTCGVRVTGALFCLPVDPSQAIGDPRVDNFNHRRHGPVCAQLSKEDWEGHFGAYGHVPYIQDSSARDAAVDYLRTWYRSRANTFLGEDFGLFMGRASGALGANPNGTGAMHDHGAAGCSAGLSSDAPDCLYWMSAASANYFRGWAVYQYNDGTTMRRENHTGMYIFKDEPWSTGSGGTDYLGFSAFFDNSSAAGLRRPLVWRDGYNASHYSFNNLCGYYELTGDPSIGHYLESRAVLLEMNNNLPPVSVFNQINSSTQYIGVGHNGPNYNQDNNAQTRGWGRMALVAAHLWHLGFRRGSLKDAVSRLLDWVFWTDAGNDPALANKLMKPMDHRDYSAGAWNFASIKLWQHSLLLMGLWALIKQPGLLTKSDKIDLEQRTLRAARTIIDYLIIYDTSSSQYRYIQNYTWNNGDPYSVATLLDPNQTVAQFYSGFWSNIILYYMAARGNAKAQTITSGWSTNNFQDAQHATAKLLP